MFCIYYVNIVINDNYTLKQFFRRIFKENQLYKQI